MIKHIVFDLGNVLVHIHPEKAMNEFARRCGLSVNRVHAFFLSPLHLDFMAGRYSPEQFFKRIQAEYPCRISQEEFIGIWETVIGEPKSGIPELIDRLSGHYPLSICSNTDPWHWHYVKRHYPFINQFSHYFLSYQMKRNKPDPAVFQQVLSRLGTAGNACVFVDDNAENVQQAAAFGILGIQADNTADIIRRLNDLGISL